MKYVSTRGQAPALSFDEVLLTGLARDGGLYVPEAWPVFSPADIREMEGLAYTDVAVKVLMPFMEETMEEAVLADLIDKTYAHFDDPEIAPMTPLGDNRWMLELFHGPTLAFKDYAMQFLGRMFDQVLSQRNKRVTIVGATSGDTGSAAIEACRDRDAIDIFILYPDGRISEVQRRQMTTVDAPNVTTIAIKGTFDDCQALVKGMFNDQDFRDQHSLSAVNSINWARIVAQIVYYFWAAVKVGAPDKAVTFAVPTGNFGNVFAGYAAHRCGLPINRLVIGSNRNDILTRFFRTGRMEAKEVKPTLSPSMDIQVSSNFERLLFELFGRDGIRVREAMDRFSRTGAFEVDDESLTRAQALFESETFNDEQTKDMIRNAFLKSGLLLDPHTAIGVAAGRARRRQGDAFDVPLVCLATAHPAKFPRAVEEAIGGAPALPPQLTGLMTLDENYETLPANLETVKDFIAGRLAGAAP